MDGSAPVLVVSPDRSLLQAARRCVQALGHLPLDARSVADAQRMIARLRVDLVCLDSLLPKPDVERFWRWLSTNGNRPPALILLAPPSARTVAALQPKFFRPGHDGLVEKPLQSSELAREISRVLATGARRRKADVLRAGRAVLDNESRRLYLAGGAALSLTPTELRLVRCLMERPGEFVSPDELLEAVWGYAPGMGGPEVVRAHVSNVRRKLREIGEDAQLLRNIPFQGYAFVAERARRQA